MKVTISLDKPKMVVVIEGSDSSMDEMGALLEETFARMKKVWSDHLKRQTKLNEGVKPERS